MVDPRHYTIGPWKVALGTVGPKDAERIARGTTPGAYSRWSCEMEEEIGSCPWKDSEPDPDILREDRDERRRLEREATP